MKVKAIKNGPYVIEIRERAKAIVGGKEKEV